MNIKSTQIRIWSKLGMENAFYGVGIPEVFANHPEMYVMTADCCVYSGLERFANAHPDNLVNVGIQEQNMICIACGLTLEGKLVYAGTYAAFAVVRAMEQVRHNMSMLNSNIKLVGTRAGYTREDLGISHWATEDIALTRCLPNMTVLSPADSLEAVKVCIAVAEYNGPAYIRLTGGSFCPMVYREDYDFEIGRGVRLLEGRDVAILATGRVVHESMEAAKLLEQKGILADVVNIHTIKPLDETLIEDVANRFEHIFTVEEHNVIGGLGSAVAEWMACHRCGALLHRIGMQDQVYRVGSERFIWRQAGLCSDQIAERIMNSISKEG